MRQNPDPPPPSEAEDFELVDFRQLANWGRFVLHSVHRHKLLAFLTFLLTVAAVGAMLAVLPRTYHVETQLLAQRNSVLPALSNPGRTIPSDADVPTRAALETVQRRDNLLSLMKQTDLMARWELDRPTLLRFKDRLIDLVGAGPSEEDRINAMLGFLEKRLTVVTGESTVTIAIDWPDAQLAYRLVEAAQQNFLEQRHAAEVSSIAEAISILEGHATNLRESIDTALVDVKRGRVSRPVERPSEPIPVPRRDPARDAVRDASRAEAAEVKVMRDAKRKAVNELEQFRSRRLAELQAELSQQRAVYADAHPAVASVLQSIRALQEESPQLTALRRDERELTAEYEKLSGAAAQASGAPATAPRAVEMAPRRRADGTVEDIDGEYARTQLRFAMEKYDALLERIDSARIELDAARAAFKYRYSVIRPPILPRRAEKPKIPPLLGAGTLAAIGLAMLVAALVDLRSGRILELWQLEKALGLPVLGAVPRP